MRTHSKIIHSVIHTHIAYVTLENAHFLWNVCAVEDYWLLRNAGHNNKYKDTHRFIDNTAGIARVLNEHRRNNKNYRKKIFMLNLSKFGVWACADKKNLPLSPSLSLGAQASNHTNSNQYIIIRYSIERRIVHTQYT